MFWLCSGDTMQYTDQNHASNVGSQGRGGGDGRDREARGARIPSPSHAIHMDRPMPRHLGHLLVCSHCVSYRVLSIPTKALTLRAELLPKHAPGCAGRAQQHHAGGVLNNLMKSLEVSRASMCHSPRSSMRRPVPVHSMPKLVYANFLWLQDARALRADPKFGVKEPC